MGNTRVPALLIGSIGSARLEEAIAYEVAAVNLVRPVVADWRLKPEVSNGWLSVGDAEVFRHVFGRRRSMALDGATGGLDGLSHGPFWRSACRRCSQRSD